MEICPRRPVPFGARPPAGLDSFYALHPFLLHVGHLALPAFGVLAAAGLMLALGLSQYTAARAGVDPDKLWHTGLFAVIAAFVSSRLLLAVEHLHSFVQYPLLLLAVPSLTASGLLVTAIATYVWMRSRQIPLLPALDAWAPCSMGLWACLATGHFLEGSDPGMPTRLRLGVRMPGPAGPPQHPVALYAAAVAIVLGTISWHHLKARRVPGRTAALTLGATAISQFLLSFVRQPGVAAFAGLDALQGVALGMLLAGAALYFASDSPAHPVPPRDSLR